jgi:hypothetical protein
VALLVIMVSVCERKSDNAVLPYAEKLTCSAVFAATTQINDRLTCGGVFEGSRRCERGTADYTSRQTGYPEVKASSHQADTALSPQTRVKVAGMPGTAPVLRLLEQGNPAKRG